MAKHSRIPAIQGVLEPRKVYPVTEEELYNMKKGSDLTIYLKVAISLLSIAFSLTVTSFIIDAEKVGLQGLAVFYGAIIFAWCGGGFALYMSRQKESHLSKILDRIEARIKDDKDKQQGVVAAS